MRVTAGCRAGSTTALDGEASRRERTLTGQWLPFALRGKMPKSGRSQSRRNADFGAESLDDNFCLAA
jgi:hypothetical protein